MTKAGERDVAAAWRHTLHEGARDNMLIDTPLGKTAFAWGVAYALERLRDNGVTEAEWRRMHDELQDFCEDYMAKAEVREILRRVQAAYAQAMASE